MHPAARRRVKGRVAFVALFGALFLLFTPFEQGGQNPSMFPKYFSAGVSFVALVPLFAITQVRFRVETRLVLVVLAMVAFHSLVVSPVPFHFTLLIVLNTLLAAFIYEASFTWRPEFVAAVSWLLLVNAAMITVQALLFYLAGGPIVDFHKMIFGSDSRFVEDFLHIARFSGLQVEPGTYANYMGCLAAILILSSAYTTRLVVTSFMAVLSVFMTNSGSSIYFVPVLVVLFGYVWRSKVRVVHLLVLVGAVLAYMAVSGVVEHLETRFLEHDDGSLLHRVEGVHAWTALSLDEKFIGVGFGADPCVRCYYQDIGMVFNLVTRGGVIVTLAFALMVGRMLVANGLVLGVILVLIPINEKMFFYDAAIWVFFLFAMTHRAEVSPRPGTTCAGERARPA